MAPFRRPPTPPPLLIFVGLYQEELVRFRVALDEEDRNRFRLQQLQSDHIQEGAINVLRNRGTMLASGGADGRVVMLDLKQGTSWDVTVPNEESVNCMDFSGCGRFLFVGGAERSVFYVDIGKRAVICRKWNAHRAGVAVLRVRPGTGRMMFTVGQDREVKYWDLYLSRTTATDEFRVDERFAGPIACMEFSPSGGLLVTAGEGFARVTSVPGGRIVRAVTFEGEKPVAAVWLSESVLLVGMSSGRGASFRTDDECEPRWTRFYYDGKLAAMARKGKYLVTASNRTVLALWEILDGFRIWPICRTEIVGKATSLVMVDAAQLGLEEFVSETEAITTQDESKKDDLHNNTFGDTPSEGSDESVTFVSEEQLELESEDDEEEEEEVLQIIPETPQEASSQSLIEFPEPSRSESSLESLRVEEEERSDCGSEGTGSDEQIVVVRSYTEEGVDGGVDDSVGDRRSVRFCV
ncbi:hypothetical protein quinque_015194 [Culex quinquefasciatus]